MWKLAALLLAVVMGGCGPTYSATMPFEVRTTEPFIADLCSEAAARINAEGHYDVTVELMSIAPGQAEEPNAFPAPESTSIGPGSDPAGAGVGASHGQPFALIVGPEATVDAVEEAMREWLDVYDSRG